MSFNQSNSHRSETTQYRKSGRSAGPNQQRTSSGSYGKGAGGGPAPSPSLPSDDRSFKKPHNAQGGHSSVQNGPHSQSQLPGASEAPLGGGDAKQVEPSAPQRSTRAVPKAPTSQSASMSSDTHKEVRLDERADTNSDGGVSGSRSRSQQIPSFAPAHPMNYYPNSYADSPIYYPAPGSLPLTSSPITSDTQATRFKYRGPQNASFMNPNLNSLPVSKAGIPMPVVAELPNSEQSCDTHNLVSSASSGTVQVTVKPASGCVGEKTAGSSLSDISPAVGKDGTTKPSRPSGETIASHPQRDSETVPEKSSQQIKPSSELLVFKSMAGATKQCAVVSSLVSTESLASNSLPTAPSEESIPIAHVEGRRTESLSRSNSIKDNQKKAGKKGQIQTQQQVGGQSTTTSSLRTAETDFVPDIILLGDCCRLLNKYHEFWWGHDILMGL